MSPLEYCQSKAAPPGSAVYYSLIFTEPAQREAIQVLYAFCLEIETIVSTFKELSIAQQKLNWWQEELNRIFLQQATHPVGKALQDIIQKFPIQQSFLIHILEGISHRLVYSSYQTFNEYTEQHYRAISAFPLLVATVQQDQQPAVMQFVHDLGIALQCIETLLQLQLDKAHGFSYIPADILEKAPAVPEQAMIFIDYTRQYYNKALQNLPAENKKTHLNSLILAAIYLKLAEKIAKNPARTLNKHIELMPIQKLWITYKVKRITLAASTYKEV